MATKSKSTATPAEKPVAKKAAPAQPVAAKKAAPKTVMVKPVVDVPAPAPAPAPTAAPAKKAAAPRKAVAPKITPVDTVLNETTAPQPFMTSEERTHYVSVAAFYIAERRGFAPGNPAQDWVDAEAEVDRLIATGYFAT